MSNLPLFSSQKSAAISTDASNSEGQFTSEPTVFSVEDLNRRIKQTIEGSFDLVWVKGEISNFKPHSSGHFYFSLKDAKAQVKAVMFRGYNSKLPFKPHDGLEVIVRGRITVYEPRGDYQISCEMMEPVGAGALQKAFEQLKLKLKNEGLFDSARKKPIPVMPRHVAIVTSPTGAAIRDMLNVMGRRNRSVQITIVPTVVQGADAAPQICEAFQKAQRLNNVDVIIVGRGGGSIEDLWAFNDEKLARLISQSSIPVISAVGHEIDFTIADFVADLRAPTPSAAAELVVKNSEDLSNKIQSLQRLLILALSKFLKMERQKLVTLQAKLVDPKRRLQDLAQRNDDLVDRLLRATRNALKNRSLKIEILSGRIVAPQAIIKMKRQRLEMLRVQSQNSIEFLLETKASKLSRAMAVLDSISPLKVVERGYSLVSAKGKIIKSATQVDLGEEIDIQLASGSLKAQVSKIKK